MYNYVIIRFSEIFLKSGYVKRYLKNALINNLCKKIKEFDPTYKVIKTNNRIYIETQFPEKVAEKASKVAGIKSSSPAYRVELSENVYLEKKAMEIIATEALNFCDFINLKQDNSFAVRVRRVGKHKFSSMELERFVGSKIVETKKSKVDLGSPDKTVFIEIRDQECFIYSEKVDGVGGLPYGTQGKVVVLLSEGIDSPAATYLMMKRGLKVIALNFRTSNTPSERVKKIVKRLEEYSPEPIKTYSIYYSPFLEKASKEAGKFTCIMCKRVMLKVAEKIAKKNNAMGIVTGDNLGQVASQTLNNISVVQYGRSIPIYRPLIGFDKTEIIRLAKKIGTYKYQSVYKCDYVPDKPSTKAKLDVILNIENNLNLDVEISNMLEEI